MGWLHIFILIIHMHWGKCKRREGSSFASDSLPMVENKLAWQVSVHCISGSSKLYSKLTLLT